MRLLFAALLSAAVAACYSPSFRDGEVVCEADLGCACPSGFTCYVRLSGGGPEPTGLCFSAPPSTAPDAGAPADAGPPADAGVQDPLQKFVAVCVPASTVDAGPSPDATPEVSPDASATSDAALPDAT
jgi:hypothetical protein